MYTITVPTRNDVAPKTQAIFDTLNYQLGMVPNLYATIGWSANALENYLSYQKNQAKGAFNAREREAVNLAVSEANQCKYCLAAHTTIAKMNGFTEEETFQLRTGTISNSKLRILTQLAINIVKMRGQADPELVQRFFDLGLSRGALIDLISLVSEKTMSNYVHRLTQVPLDFPPAKPIPTAELV